MEQLGFQHILLGLGGVGVFGGIFLFLSKFLDKSSESKKREIEHKVKQDVIKKKIKEVKKNQKKKLEELDDAQKETEETKDKINQIVKKASKDIDDILKEKEISEIQDNIDEKWDDL